MVTLTQKGRPLRIVTPLGADVLLLERFVADEGVSKQFEIKVDLLSVNASIVTKDILQKRVTIEIDLPDASVRYFNGFIRRFTQHGRDSGLTTYRAEIVPTSWFLSLSTDCRVFQTMSVPDIIKKVFDDAGMKDYRMATTGTYPVRDYCVQYRESHLDFVSRLMEEEGIFYFFEHTDKANTLVVADSVSAVKATPVASITMNATTALGVADDSISDLEVGAIVSSAKLTLADYNDTVPRKLLSTIPGSSTAFGAPATEIYDYPGEFGLSADGDRAARIRMDELEALAKTVHGHSNSRGLGSGQKVTIADHYRSDVNGAYHLLSLHHDGNVGSYISGKGDTFSYSVSFEGIPAAVLYRPPRVTPKSIVHGAQTAVVVGPSGEEIFVDKYGRVKVQFYWDRVGKLDDKSSCWVRVSNTWAGKQWGFIQIPRIGQEVIVEFLEGDPDKPIITGRVYNADMMPPYALPANGTQSGLKTRSSKGGDATMFNELRFEDKKGSEEVFLHSQKDFNAVTENNETWKVLGLRTTEITKDETKTVKEGNDTTTISKGNHSLTISEGNQTIAVSKGDQTTTVDQGKQTITVDGDQTITVKTGKHSFTVKTGDMITEVSTGNQTNTVKTGNLTTEVSVGNHSTTVKVGNVSLKANVGSITNEAMQSIELKCGPSSIKIAPDGITITGVQVKIAGSAMTEVKGAMTTVKGDGMLTLKGGVTMIN